MYSLFADEQEKFLFWNGGIGDMNRIIVFGDKNKTKVWDKEAVEIALRENVWVFQKVTKGPNAAKDLYQAIGSFINGINFIYKCIVVFYYDRMPHTKVLIDNPLSPAACVNTYAADNVGTYHACVYPEMWSNFTSYLNEYSDQQMTDPDQQMIDPDQQTIDTEQQMDDPDQQTTDTVQQTIDPDQQIIDPDQPTIDPDQQLVDQQMIDSASMTNPHIMHLLFVTTAVTFIAFC